jgi:hypothetical protein
MDYPVPAVEFGDYRGGSVVVPVVTLFTCERSEKERIVRLDAYTLTIAFAVPEDPSGQRSVGERICYTYASSVATALKEDPALGGVVDRAVLTGKKYIPPKHEHCGEGWEVVLTLRITVEQVTDSR